MGRGERWIDSENFEDVLRLERKVDGTRTDEEKARGRKRNERNKSDYAYDVDLELAKQKKEKAEKRATRIVENNKKLREKSTNGYTGGKGLKDAGKIKKTDENENGSNDKVTSKSWWKERPIMQKKEIENSRKAVKKAKDLINEDTVIATEGIPEAIPPDKTSETVITILEEEKTGWEKHLVKLNELFKGAEDDRTRSKLDSKIKYTEGKISEIDEKIKGVGNRLNEEPLNIVEEKIKEPELETGIKTIEDLKQEEKNLMTEIQELPEGAVDDALWEKKKDIIAKLEANREEQRKMMPEAGEKIGEQKHDDSDITAGNIDIVKNIKSEDRKADDWNKLIGQNEWNKLIKKNREEKLAKKHSAIKQPVEPIVEPQEPVPKEKIERPNNLSEDEKEKIREAMMDQEVERIGTEASLENREQIIKESEERINAQDKEISKLQERLKKAETIMLVTNAEIEKQVEQSQNPTLKESIKKYLKDPKVRTAIVFGLAGAGVYAASGGTAVPIYFAVKSALAKMGISIFVPAAKGLGLSTWGTAAAGGGFARYLSEKLGLTKGEKSDREKWQEGLDKIKNIKEENIPENQKNDAISIETVRKYYEDNKNENSDELNLEEIKKMTEAIFPGTTINPFATIFNKEGVKNNEIFNWLNKKKKEIEKAGDKKEKPENAAVKDIELNAKIYEDMIDEFQQDFNNGKIKGEEIYNKANAFRNWMEIELAGKKDMRKEVVKKIRGIDPEVQAKMVNSMLEYAITNNKDNKEIADRVRYLTMRPDLNEIINIPGINKETKQWLKREQEIVDIISPSAEPEKIEENKENKDSDYTEIVKRESEIFKKFAEAFKNKQKTGKDVFDYLGELSAVYFKDSSKYTTIFFAEIENQEKLSGNKFNELKIDLIDSMVDYLRVEGKKEQKYQAKQFTTLLFPWSGAKAQYSYAGKKENVEWLGWKYQQL